MAINDLTVDPSQTGSAWAAGASSVYRTTDGGGVWQALRLPPVADFSYPANVPPNGYYYGYTTVAVNGLGTALVGDSTGDVYRSIDHGRTWKQTLSDPFSCGREGCVPVIALIFDPQNPLHALVSGVGGEQASGPTQYYETNDAGATWIEDGVGGDASYSSLAATPRPPLPVDPRAEPQHLPAGAIYVAATHHLIAAPFLAAYRQYGGEQVFGLPLSEAYTEAGQQVQVFERARLVLQQGVVTISPLGYWLTADRAFPSAVPTQAHYFADTHQTLAGRFLAFWLTHQGAVLLGPPISPVLHEPNGDGSGRAYMLQWFENGRLEYHPELEGTPYEVSLGLVGKEFLRQRNWL